MGLVGPIFNTRQRKSDAIIRLITCCAARKSKRAPHRRIEIEATSYVLPQASRRLILCALAAPRDINLEISSAFAVSRKQSAQPLKVWKTFAARLYIDAILYPEIYSYLSAMVTIDYADTVRDLESAHSPRANNYA